MADPTPTDQLAALAAAPKAQTARILAEIEQDPAGSAALLDAALAAPRGYALGLTGPPGVGKSTLCNALIAALRARQDTVAVLAVDPSSRTSRGALLGDRTRIRANPEDRGLFIRSMAARDRLGGLAALTFPALVLMRALYDWVLVETVGVGQSETDVAQVADTVIFCIQPASGDSLQFMKAGIMEAPDLFVVGKADLGAPADKAVADLNGALALAPLPDPGWTPPVLKLSATRAQGLEDLLDAVVAHRHHLAADDMLAARRSDQARFWWQETVTREVGRRGLADAAAHYDPEAPFASAAGYLA